VKSPEPKEGGKTLAKSDGFQVVEALLIEEGEAAAEAVFGEGELCSEVLRTAGDGELGTAELLASEQGADGLDRLELEIEVGFAVEFRRAVQEPPYTTFRPKASKRRKSATFSVAIAAPSASATAAIMQSIKEPRRRPVPLNRRAAIAA